MNNEAETPNPHDEAFRHFIESVMDYQDRGQCDAHPRLLRDLYTEALKLTWSYYDDLMTECQGEDPDGPDGFSQWDHDVRFAVLQEVRSRGLVPIPTELAEDDPDAIRH